jgi:Phosphotransferase enzyme family
MSTWFPSSPDELTAAWLTDQLRAGGAEVEVVNFTAERIGTGQIGLNVRIELVLAEADATGRGVNAPLSLVAKFPSTEPKSRATGFALGNYEKEANFYTHLAAGIAMRIPKCWAAECDPAEERAVLLLEDLSPAQQGDQIAGCGYSDAELAVRSIALAHGHHWGTRAPSFEFLGRADDHSRIPMLGQMLAMTWPGFLERYEHRLPSGSVALGEKMIANVGTWSTARVGPATLTHGDYRLDNLLFGDSPQRWCAAVDWQTPSLGPGIADVAYFIGAGLNLEDRRRYERELVGGWYETVAGTGAHLADYSLAEAWEQYRCNQFAGVIMAIVASMITDRTDRGDEMFAAMAIGHFHGAIDHDSAEFLAEP